MACSAFAYVCTRLQKQQISATSFQKIFRVFADDRYGHAVEIQGKACIRKIDEDSRVTLLRTVSAALPNNGPTFTEKSWVVIVPCHRTRGSSVPAAGPVPTMDSDTSEDEWSLVKTCCQVCCESPGEGPVSAAKSELIAFVIQVLSRKARDFDQQIQDELLNVHHRQMHSATLTP